MVRFYSWATSFHKMQCREMAEYANILLFHFLRKFSPPIIVNYFALLCNAAAGAGFWGVVYSLHIGNNCRLFGKNFQMRFLEISLKCVFKGSVDMKSAVVQVMAWRRQGDKPLPEPMQIQITAAHGVSKSQWVNSPQQTIEIGTPWVATSETFSGLLYHRYKW